MKPQKTIAVVMILVSSVFTGWTCMDIAYPAILGMLGLLGLQRRFTWEIKPERRVITSLLMLLLAMLFSLHYRYSGMPGWNAQEEIMSLAWQTVTRFFLAAMILMLFLGSPQRLPPSLGLFHIANAICAGQILLLNDRFITFRLLELLSVVLVVLYAATTHGTTAPGRPSARSRYAPHWLVCSVVLVIAANGGWIVGSVLYRHVEVLDHIPLWFAKQGIAFERTDTTPAEIAFSTSGQLSSIHDLIQDRDATVVLRVKADRSPGYLRGRAFDVYDRAQWYNMSSKEILYGQRSMTPIPSNVHVFRFRDIPVSERRKMTVQHQVEFDGDTVFTPLGVGAIKVLPHTLERDGHGVFYLRQRSRHRRYGFNCSATVYREPPSPELRARMLEVPSYLDRTTETRLDRLAERIFAEAETTSEKTKAVIDHFHAHYKYSLHFEVPADRDPLVHFLFDAKSGYCEYFASGAAILLRLAGVPTRYVTGFLVTEKDPDGQLWNARNMDAHAWVEAWDQEQGQWTIVEATVADTQDGGSAIEQLGRLGGSVSVAFGQFVQAVYDYGLLGVAGWLFTAHGMTATAVLLATLTALAAWWMLFSRRRKRAGASAWVRRAPDPSRVALHKLLTRMDRRLRAAGLRRPLTETLHVFAQRLRTRDTGDGAWVGVADWYCEYAELRYRRQVQAEHIERLHRRAEGLRRSF